MSGPTASDSRRIRVLECYTCWSLSDTVGGPLESPLGPFWAALVVRIVNIDVVVLAQVVRRFRDARCIRFVRHGVVERRVVDAVAEVSGEEAEQRSGNDAVRDRGRHGFSPLIRASVFLRYDLWLLRRDITTLVYRTLTQSRDDGSPSSG